MPLPVADSNALAQAQTREDVLKPFWGRLFKFNARFGLALVLLVCVPRFVLVLQANASRNYSAIGGVMLVSALAPFVFLTRWGRTTIGIRPPQNYASLLVAFLAGLLLGLVLYAIGDSLYGNTDQNWYYYIGQSYKIPTTITPPDKAMLFAVVALTGMCFSPVGEEVFFRGIVQASFARSLGQKKASLLDSTAFAFTHIAHFGLVYIHQQWHLLELPTLLWVASMFGVSLVFGICKNFSGSLLGAILSHAAFNLAMIYAIFYLL